MDFRLLDVDGISNLMAGEKFHIDYEEEIGMGKAYKMDRKSKVLVLNKKYQKIYDDIEKDIKEYLIKHYARNKKEGGDNKRDTIKEGE